MSTVLWRDGNLDAINLIAYSAMDDSIAIYKIEDSASIGRLNSPMNPDVQLNSAIVSRLQGRIYRQNGLFIYEDTTSSNGTYVNGKFFGKNSPENRTACVLKTGDVLRIDNGNPSNPSPKAVAMVVTRATGAELEGRRIDLTNAEDITIGREVDGMQIDNDMVSATHAIFARNGQYWYVEDLDSTNGVYVNNERITGRKTLFPLDVVRIVEYEFIYTGRELLYFSEEENRVYSDYATGEEFIPEYNDMPVGNPQYSMENDAYGTTHSDVTNGYVVPPYMEPVQPVNQQPEAQYVSTPVMPPIELPELPAGIQFMGASTQQQPEPQYVEQPVVQPEPQYVQQPVVQPEPQYVQQPVVQPEPQYVQQPVVQPVEPVAQPVTPPVQTPVAPPRQMRNFGNSSGQLVIKIRERSVRKALKKQVLLKDINISVNPGELVMLLGGSGAGKTTFINAVMGYEKADGTIIHNNVDVYKDYAKVRKDIGFVPQQDLLRLDDTVYKTLENAAEMKMDAPVHVRNQRIQYVLNSLGLSREKDSKVKKLSGGQRKRLSIAVELISDPSLFFLDEPDSGLDGIMARTLMENLRTIADEGKIVMVITHAPDRVKDLFNKVIVLAKDSRDNVGHLAFFGDVQETMNFFGTDSLEGVIRRINREDEGGEGKAEYYITKYERGEF